MRIILCIGLLQVLSCANPSTPKTVTAKKASTDSTKGKSTSASKKTSDKSTDAEDDTQGEGPTEGGIADKPSTTDDPKADEEPAQELPKVNFTGGLDPDNDYLRFGTITGWAVNKDNLKEYLSVNLYFDGDNKSGKKLGTAKANLVGVDDNNGSEHAFIFYVPKENIDSKAHKIYIYAVVEGVEIPLSSKMPYSLTFYKPKGGDAEQLYNSIGFEANCKGCHRFAYETQWTKLGQGPINGQVWNETSNYLFEKINNHNAKSVPCKVLSCDKVRQWWQMEFGK